MVGFSGRCPGLTNRAPLGLGVAAKLGLSVTGFRADGAGTKNLRVKMPDLRVQVSSRPQEAVKARSFGARSAKKTRHPCGCLV